MPLTTDHNVLKVPKNNPNLWRYLDIPSFIDIIANKRLKFVRADLFEDQFEGLLPDKTAEGLNRWAAEMIKDGNLNSGYANLSENLNKSNKQAHVSCWCKENHQMVHMWKIYSKEHGVCIETTYNKLISSCNFEDGDYFPTEIQYFDFKNDNFDYQSNALSPFTIKRKEYKSENEFRLLIKRHKSLMDQMKDVEKGSTYLREYERIYMETPVLYCDTDINNLISKVHLSPYAPGWYFDIIRNLLDVYNLSNKDLIKSDL